MKNTDTLSVWHKNTLIGTLWRDTSGNMGFKYEKTWLDNGFPISEVLGYRHILAYEYFSNKLAKAIGLPVPPCWLKKTNDGYYLIIKATNPH